MEGWRVHIQFGEQNFGESIERSALVFVALIYNSKSE